MYINLYPVKQLQRTKRSFLGIGLLLGGGGAYSVVRELLLHDSLQPYWLPAACIATLVGLVALAFGAGWVPFKDAYFAMNPERISYRLTLYGRERELQWQNIDNVYLTPDNVIFELKCGRQVTLRLALVPDEAVARHIEASIRLAALQQNVCINGVQVHKQRAGFAV